VREKLADLYIEVKSAGKVLSVEQEEIYRAKILTSAELVVVSQIRCDDPFQSKEDYGACACAIQNLMLTLWADGVATKWSTGKVTREPRTAQLMQIDRAAEEVIGFVWIGYPARAPRKPRRPELAQIVRRVG